jgi:hypothetical protein
MKTSMTLFGCGPKLALLSLPYVILSLIVMCKYPEFFDLRFLDFHFVKIFGFVWLGLGIIFGSTLGEEYEIYEKSVNEIIPFPASFFQDKLIRK